MVRPSPEAEFESDEKVQFKPFCYGKLKKYSYVSYVELMEQSQTNQNDKKEPDNIIIEIDNINLDNGESGSEGNVIEINPVNESDVEEEKDEHEGESQEEDDLKEGNDNERIWCEFRMRNTKREKKKSSQTFGEQSWYKEKTFFHSKTNKPILPTDPLEDSADENERPPWVERFLDETRNDFVELSDINLLFQGLWSSFSTMYPIESNADFPRACLQFARKIRNLLREQKLRKQFVFHLHLMWNHNLISSDDILACLKEVGNAKRKR